MLFRDLQLGVKSNILSVVRGEEEGCRRGVPGEGIEGFEGFLRRTGGSCAVSHPQGAQGATKEASPVPFPRLGGGCLCAPLQPITGFNLPGPPMK